MRSHPDKSQRKLRSLILIFSAEIVALWFGLRYILSQAEYQPSSDIPELLPANSSTPVPAYEATKYESWNALNNRLQATIFPPGTSATTILRNLGEPVWRKPGFWDNSVAWSYENMVLEGIDIGYIFDTRSNKLRQVEIAVPPSTNFGLIRASLESFIGEQMSVQVEEGLQRVYERSQGNYSFTVDGLTGVIQRNSKDRIYVAVWQTGFH